MTKGNHVKLLHPVAGIYFTSLTHSDSHGPKNCLADLRRMMKQKGLTPCP